MAVPSKFTAGDSISWNDLKWTDYLGNTIASDDGWTLTYHFRGNKSGATLDVVGVANDAGGWDFSMSKTDSKKFDGLALVSFVVRATKAADARTLYQSECQVGIDLAGVTSTPFDGTSQAEKDLLAVQSAMRAMVAGGAVQDYSVGGRSVRKMQLTDLLALESKLKIEVARERQASKIARGDSSGNKLLVRFK